VNARASITNINIDAKTSQVGINIATLIENIIDIGRICQNKIK
jgi:hypothetical protein